MKKTLQLLLLLLTTTFFAQSNSSPKPVIQLYNNTSGEFVDINTSSQINLGCGVENVQINAAFITDLGSTDSYRIEQIPYSSKGYLPTTGSQVITPDMLGIPGELITTPIDDQWGTIQSLSSDGNDWNFCFFGNSRNQFVISGNGMLSFDTTYANTYSDWNLQDMGKIYPSANLGDNKDAIIMNHDFNPTSADALFDSYMFWSIVGTQKERTFIWGLHHMPMYACNGDFGFATHQVVFYETTNIIEFHIQDKPICDTWNGGLQAFGIQNVDQTIGLALPRLDNLESPIQILDLNDGFYDTNFDPNYPVQDSVSYRLIPDGINGIAPEFGWYINWDSVTNTGTLVSANPILDVSTDEVPFGNNVVYSAVVKYTDYCSGEEYYATNEVLFVNENAIQMHLQEQNSADDTTEFINIEEISICTTTDYSITAIIQDVDTSLTNSLEWTVESYGNPSTIVQTNTITSDGNINYLIPSGSLTSGVIYTYTCTLTSGSCIISDSIIISAEDPIPAPYGDSPVSLCDNGSTLADILVFNTSGYDGIYWYSTETQESGTELDFTTLLVDGTTYYAFQAVCGCGNNDCLGVLPITVNLIENIPAPVGETNQYFCTEDVPTLADLLVENTIDYDSIYWTSNIYCQGGQLLSPTTPLVDSETYYAYQTPNNGCCPDYLAITIHLENAIPAPTGETNQYFFIENDPTFADIITFNTGGFTNIYWFLSTSQFTPINPTESLVEGTFYAFQGLGACSADLPVNIYLINLDGDEDGDTITNGEEDINNDGNPANDDTDGDNIPDFLDTDDDGDHVPTSIEAVVITRNNLDINYLDTDGDLVPNYLDNDDDNDGILTIDEDYDGDGNPVNDDTNTDGIPDYLQQSVALGTSNVNINLFSIHPNPVKDILSLDFVDANNKTTVIIYNIFGSLVYKKDYYQKSNININVSNLNAGVYFINTKVDNNISTKKFIKL